MAINQRDLTLPANLRVVGIQQTSHPLGYADAFRREYPQTQNLPSGARSIAQTTQQPSSQSKTSNGLPVALQNIVATGSATPKMATLINTQTGDRQPVAVGSAQAQILFGQGYVLEQSPGVPTPGAISAPQPTIPITPTASVQPSKLSILGVEQARIRKEAFTSVYGHTPDEWQDLMPEAQRRLRNQRVQDLASQLGDVNTAIATVKQEMEDAKADEEKEYDRAREKLNDYLKYGVVDTLPEDQLSQLAGATGMNVEAIRKISEQNKKETGGEFKLEQLGSDLYTIRLDPKTGDVESKLVQRGRTGGEGGEVITVSSSAQLAAKQLLSEVDRSNPTWFSDLMLTVSDIYPDIKTRMEVQKALNQLFEQQDATGTNEEIISDLFDEGIENGESLETIARDLTSLGYSKDTVYKEYQSRFK